MDLTYDEVIRGINDGSITDVFFSIDGYSHYRNCSIRRLLDSQGYEHVEIKLTEDGSERCLLYGGISESNENEKLFHVENGKRLTLKEIWKRVRIKEIRRL